MKKEKKVAIHHREGSFSNKWIEYCEKNGIEYKLVNCYSSSIVKDLSDCNILLWHWHHYEYPAKLMAKQLVYSLTLKGIKVLPNIQTCLYYDDKLGQKYLFESIGVPMVKSYAFYNKQDAYNWIDNSTFPKIFKLRGGASSINVRLIKSKQEAKRYVKKMFSTGIGVSRVSELRDSILFFKRDKTFLNFMKIGRGVFRIFFPAKEFRDIKEKGYLYAQDFIPNQNSDIRVTVIGKRAFAKKRMVREGDFRASGSGNRSYNIEDIPIECIDIAFKVMKKLEAQVLALDFIFDGEKYLLLEISFGFSKDDNLCYLGYWNEKLDFISTEIHPEYFMVQDMLSLD